MDTKKVAIEIYNKLVEMNVDMGTLMIPVIEIILIKEINDDKKI